MKTKIIRIGNSQGIRIPKLMIEESGITEEVEMIPGDNEIILRSAGTNRMGWEEAFAKMVERDDDALLDQKEIERPSDWDETEWTW